MIFSMNPLVTVDENLIDTSDATASASNIEANYTAYVKGKKIVGTKTVADFGFSIVDSGDVNGSNGTFNIPEYKSVNYHAIILQANNPIACLILPPYLGGKSGGSYSFNTIYVPPGANIVDIQVFSNKFILTQNCNFANFVLMKWYVVKIQN